MNGKNLGLAATLVLLSAIAVAHTGCSSDDDGKETFSCPKAGDKNCENDPVTTKATAELCMQCEDEYRAYNTCLGRIRPACASDGTSEPDPTDKCKTELNEVITCVQGGESPSGSDAGGD